MANQKHISILYAGVQAWNAWRKNNPNIRPFLMDISFPGANFRGMNLNRVNLVGADLNGADLRDTNLSEANLSMANLYRADLRGAKVSKAELKKAYISEADLRDADFWSADFTGADLSKSNFTGSDISRTRLIEVNLGNANLSNCRVYGISAWNLTMNEFTLQSNLIITRKSEPTITVDNLKVSQFIYLILNNKEMRHVIDTITEKIVLILGRFTEERKIILDAIRHELRKHDYVPVIFDFDKPSNRNTQETVLTLAGMSRFIVADMTDPVCIPFEIGNIAEKFRSVPIRPLLLKGREPWGMWDSIKGLPQVLEIAEYIDKQHIVDSIVESIIKPVEQRLAELGK